MDKDDILPHPPRFLVFLGRERPYAADIGDTVSVKCIEPLTETQQTLSLEITHRRSTYLAIYLTAKVTLDNEPYRAEISMTLKHPAWDTIVLNAA